MITNNTNTSIGFYIETSEIKELDNSNLISQIKNLIVKKKIAARAH